MTWLHVCLLCHTIWMKKSEWTLSNWTKYVCCCEPERQPQRPGGLPERPRTPWRVHIVCWTREALCNLYIWKMKIKYDLFQNIFKNVSFDASQFDRCPYYIPHKKLADSFWLLWSTQLATRLLWGDCLFAHRQTRQSSIILCFLGSVFHTMLEGGLWVPPAPDTQIWLPRKRYSKGIIDSSSSSSSSHVTSPLRLNSPPETTACRS